MVIAGVSVAIGVPHPRTKSAREFGMTRSLLVASEVAPRAKSRSLATLGMTAVVVGGSCQRQRGC